MAVTAYVLIVTDPVQTKEVLRRIRELEAVKSSYEVMGPYDIIVEIEVRDLAEDPSDPGRGDSSDRRDREHDQPRGLPGGRIITGSRRAAIMRILWRRPEGLKGATCGRGVQVRGPNLPPAAGSLR